MREKDIKILWGRSGNRCTICKLELTPDGSRETLGEMAHIIARSLDGPRGIPEGGADSYENLILLCPTHHAEIDKNVEAWPPDRLRAIKADHESWVSDRLRAGQIAVQPVDNSAFLEARRQAWNVLARGQIAVIVSLSPLRASMETLNPMDAQIVQLLESARVPDGGTQGAGVNRYRTRPTATGIANEDFRRSDGNGYWIEIFRVGHCEYFIELAGSVKAITDFARDASPELAGTPIIRYTDVAAAVELGLLWAWNVWRSALPYTYMTATVRLINTSKTTLYSREKSWSGGLFGFPTTAGFVEYSDTAQKDTNVEVVTLSALRLVSNAYGLVLAKVRDEAGKYVRPERMR